LGKNAGSTPCTLEFVFWCGAGTQAVVVMSDFSIHRVARSHGSADPVFAGVRPFASIRSTKLMAKTRG